METLLQETSMSKAYYLPIETILEIDNRAKKQGVSPSAVVREALKTALTQPDVDHAVVTYPQLSE